MTLSLGVDIGREKDATAFVLVEQVPYKEGQLLRNPNKKPPIFVRGYKTLVATPFHIQEQELEGLKNRFGSLLKRIVIDATFNPQLAETAQRRWGGVVEPYKFTEQSKADLVGRAYEYFTDGRVGVPLSASHLIEEMEWIRREITAAGNVVYRDDPHGDLSWALLMALWGIPKSTVGIVDMRAAFSRRGPDTTPKTGLLPRF